SSRRRHTISKRDWSSDVCSSDLIKLHRQPKGMIKSATISRHASGKYYISLLCKEEINELPKTNSAIGIDLGITDFAILSDGQKIDNHKFTSKMEKKLKRDRKSTRLNSSHVSISY